MVAVRKAKAKKKPRECSARFLPWGIAWSGTLPSAAAVCHSIFIVFLLQKECNGRLVSETFEAWHGRDRLEVLNLGREATAIVLKRPG